MKNKNRNRLIADWKFQGGICIRFAIYWFVCYFVTIATIFGFASLEGTTQISGSVSRFFTPALLAVTLVLPLALLELLAFTNRFVGPMVNLRQRLRQLAAGEMPDEVHFRSDDLLKEFEDDFNVIRARMQHAPVESEASEHEKVYV